jgi:hypothetical protein
MFKTVRAETVVTLNAASATTVYTYKVVGAGVLNANQITGTFEAVVANGGFTTTAPLITVAVNGTAVATYTTGTVATAKAIGDEVQFTVNTTNAPTKALVLAATDVITVTLTTQGVGGTVTGTVRVFLPLDENLG